MRNVSLVIALLTGTGIAAGIGCGSSNQKQPATSAKVTTAVSSTVPVGTEFMVRLNTPVGTTISSPGQFFTAVVLTPLRSPGGVTVIPQGALVRGRIAGVDAGPASNVRLSFSSITTQQGTLPLHATLSRSQPSGSQFRPQNVYTTAPLPYDAVLLPPAPPRVPIAPYGYTPQPSGVGGGPAPLELPVGTPLELILTAPIGIVTHTTGPTPPAQTPAPSGTVGMVVNPSGAKATTLNPAPEASVPARSRYEHYQFYYRRP